MANKPSSSRAVRFESPAYVQPPVRQSREVVAARPEAVGPGEPDDRDGGKPDRCRALQARLKRRRQYQLAVAPELHSRQRIDLGVSEARSPHLAARAVAVHHPVASGMDDVAGASSHAHADRDVPRLEGAPRLAERFAPGVVELVPHLLRPRTSRLVQRHGVMVSGPLINRALSRPTPATSSPRSLVSRRRAELSRPHGREHVSARSPRMR